MDVGLTVTGSGLIAAFFALLACIALSVELGNKPALMTKEAAKKKPIKSADSKEADRQGRGKIKGKGRAFTTAQAKRPKAGSRRKSDKTNDTSANEPELRAATKELLAKTIIESDFGRSERRPGDSLKTSKFEEQADRTDRTSGKTASEMESAAQGMALQSMENMIRLQRQFVDGFLGPRSKYDVALAVLSEFQNGGVNENEQAETMASEFYLSATRNLTTSKNAKGLIEANTLVDSSNSDNEQSRISRSIDQRRTKVDQE